MPLLGFETIVTWSPEEQRFFMDNLYSSVMTLRELDSLVRQFPRLYLQALAAQRQNAEAEREARLGALERMNSKNLFNINWK